MHNSQYAPSTHAIHNNYIPSSSHWQYAEHFAGYTNMMHYTFAQPEIPILDIDYAQQENMAQVPIAPQTWQPYENYCNDASQRRSSLQPPQNFDRRGQARPRSPSLTSLGVSSPVDTPQGGLISRTASPGAPEPEQYGRPIGDGSWTCSYPGCTSSVRFRRACDLRKHHRRHFKRYHCSYSNCAHSTRGFSSKKDCDRHEASHNPSISCSHPHCSRIFSRRDNMVGTYSNFASSS